MKFKLLSAVLLLACFVFLGVLSGAIPVTELTGDVAAGLFRGVASEPSPEPSAAVRTPGTAPSSVPTEAPDGTAPTAGAAALPAPKVAPTKAPYAAPSPTFPPVVPKKTDAPVPPSAPPPSAVPEPTSAPERTAMPEPSPTPEPTPIPEAAPEPDLWEPAAAVISTTITWKNDPIQNDTDYAVDGASLLGRMPDLELPAEGYQILIIHTHGSEAYTPSGEDQYEATSDYRTTDPDHSIIRVGQALGDALASYGLNVLVDTGLYDWPSYDGAYARSGAAVQTYLEQYPTIRVVIDLHRDALGDDATTYRTVSDQVQPDAAQIMFVVGTDVNLAHPAWRENLAIAMGLQGLVEDKYPHLMRPTLLCPYRYNQQLTTGSVLLEIGTAGNTLEEALTAAELFAEVAGPALAARIGE